MTRALGATERGVWLLDQAGTLNPLVHLRLAGPLSPDALRAGLAHAQARHPGLRARVATERGPRFVHEGVGTIPLRCVERRDDRHWVEEAEAEINAPIDWRAGPLARAVLLSAGDEHDLLVVAHHAVLDGSGMPVVLRHVLEGAADPRECPPAHAPMPPTLESVLGARARLGSIGRSLAALAGAGLPARFAVDVDAPPALRHTVLRADSLDPDESGALAARARRERCTLHGALCAALLQSTAAEGDVWSSGRRAAGCLSPVALRGRVAVDPEGLGLFLSGVATFHRRERFDDFWPLARDVTRALRAALDRGDHLALAAAQSLAYSLPGASPAALARAAEATYPAVAAVSNAGAVELPAVVGGLRPRALDCAVGVNCIVGGVVGLVALTFAGRLSLCFLHARPSRSDARAARVAEGCLGRLHAATGAVHF